MLGGTWWDSVVLGTLIFLFLRDGFGAFCMLFSGWSVLEEVEGVYVWEGVMTSGSDGGEGGSSV